MYGLKTKDEVLKVVQKWYSDIAELREKHTIFVVMRDNSGENKSQKICDFFESKESKTIIALLSINGRMDNQNHLSILC